MTPLAQLITRQRISDRKPAAAVPSWWAKLESSDCHCFEVSEVTELAQQLWDNLSWKPSDDQRVFLPSPLTWIEWRVLPEGREGFLCEERVRGSDREIVMQNVQFVRGHFYSADIGEWGLAFGDEGTRIFAREDQPIDERYPLVTTCCAFLSLINTPRIIGRRQHMPHAGLQRQMARAKGMVGKFPLHAWTEIKLEVMSKPAPEGEYATHLTGGKALHFCRAHLRIRLGQVEIVSAHWRGDPALGIKQTRYSVIPPKQPPRIQA